MRIAATCACLVLLAGSLSALTLPDDGDAPRRRKVLLVGIDGLRPDALAAARTPRIDALAAEGALSTTAQAGDITVSGPGWSSVLTGVWRDKHGVRDNKFEGNRLAEFPCFFGRLKKVRPDLVTASFVSWKMLEEHIIESSGADIRFYRDHHEEGDGPVAAAAAAALREKDPDVAFVYFGRVDSAGHAHGFHPSVPEYLEEIERTDALLGKVLDALQDRPARVKEDWLVLLTTDHGGTLDRKHGRDEPDHRTIVYLASGEAAARGTLLATVSQVDVVPTALAHLGIEPDPAWGLDGRVSGLKTTMPFDENLLYNGDAERTTPASGNGENRGIAGWKDLGGMTVVAYGTGEGFPGTRSRGSSRRGRSLFTGGKEGDSAISQVLDLRDAAADIDGGRVTFELSAFLGGYRGQRDLALLRARFRDGREALLGCAVVGPVTLEDRRREIGGKDDDLTGLLQRSGKGPVPPGTRTVEVTLESKVGSGNTDGYADDLSLVLRRAR